MKPRVALEMLTLVERWVSLTGTDFPTNLKKGDARTSCVGSEIRIHVNFIDFSDKVFVPFPGRMESAVDEHPHPHVRLLQQH